MASAFLLKSGAVLIIITCGLGNTGSRSRLQSSGSFISITRRAGESTNTACWASLPEFLTLQVWDEAPEFTFLSSQAEAPDQGTTLREPLFLEQYFSNFSVCVSHLGKLVKMKILIWEVWGGPRDSAFFTSFQVMVVCGICFLQKEF